MRLWILSDIHIESCLWDVPQKQPDYDVLIAAGDIHSPASKGVEWLAARAEGRPVIYVPGNHEWYAPRVNFNVREESARALDLAARLGVHFLMSGAVTIDGVRFLGTTLWTDYNFYGDAAKGMAMAARYINDHRVIFPEINGSPLTPEKARVWHSSDRAWLERELAQTVETESPWIKTVVVTHHMPHPLSVDAQYAGDPLNPAFCSDLSRIVETSGAAAWIHGHTHKSFDYVAGGVRVVCNPKGYGPSRKGAPIENRRFDPSLVIEI